MGVVGCAGGCQESTCFSPNKLVFGTCSPLAVLKGDCADTKPPSNLVDYENRFRHCLFVAGCMALEQLSVSQTKMKRPYDHRSEHHEYSPGDHVLLLMPVVGSVECWSWMRVYCADSREIQNLSVFWTVGWLICRS